LTYLLASHRSILSCLLILYCFCLPSSAQSPAAPSPPSPPPSPGGGGGGSSLAIESQMIAYEAINELAKEIAHRMDGPCKVHIRANAESKRPSARVEDLAHCAVSDVLLGTPTNMAAIGAYQAFKASAETLTLLYTEAAANPAEASSTPMDEATAAISESLAAAIPAISGALTALRGQTTQTGGSFSPVDQALYSDLEREIFLTDRNLVVTAYPNDYEAAYTTWIGKPLNKIRDARAEAIKTLSKRRTNPRDPHYDPKYDPLNAELKGLEGQYTAVQTAITSSGANSNILLGAALLAALGATYDVLIVANDAAGGGTRANQYFFLNLFIPAPHPSYNGGAIASYTLRSNDGEYKLAGTLRLVFGYTKWDQPPLRNQADKGYTNYKWDDKNNKGRWKAIY
jgi:hypothetical protein